MEALVEAVNGGVGSAVSKISTYPLDLIKTRLAISDKDATLTSVVTDLTKKDGVAGLYKGIQPKLVKSVTGKVLYFYIYQSLLDAHKSFTGAKSVGTLSNLVIGYLGEALELPVIMPLEAIVSKVQASKTNQGGVDIAKEMYKEGGLSGFYVALDAYLIGALQPAIQFTVYDQVRAIVSKIRSRKGLSGASLELSTFQAFLLGVVASSIAVTVTYPVELIRTVVQARGKKKNTANSGKDAETGRKDSIVSVAKEILRKEGIAGLFKGLGPNLVQSVLSAALMLAVKERITSNTRAFLYWLFAIKAANKAAS